MDNIVTDNKVVTIKRASAQQQEEQHQHRRENGPAEKVNIYKTYFAIVKGSIETNHSLCGQEARAKKAIAKHKAKDKEWDVGAEQEAKRGKAIARKPLQSRGLRKKNQV